MANLGTDLGNFDAVGTTVSGRELLVLDLCWRLRTDEGSLWTDRSYGYRLAQHLNDTLDATRLPAIASRAASELLKDERVRAASVACSLETITGIKQRLRAACTVTDADGPFRFVAAVTSDTFTLELMTAS